MNGPVTKEYLSLDNRKKLKEFVEKHEVGIFCVQNESGGISSYPLIIQSFDLDCCVWFFVNAQGHIAKGIERSPNVAFHIHDFNTHESLSLEGIGSLVTDRITAYRLWHPRFRAWFPDGIVDKDLRLLKLDIKLAHLWQAPSEVPLTLTSAMQSVINGEAHHTENEIIYTHKESNL